MIVQAKRNFQFQFFMDSEETKGRKENERGEKGKEDNEKEETIEIKLLNVQGLTEDKWIEILEETGTIA